VITRTNRLWGGMGDTLPPVGQRLQTGLMERQDGPAVDQRRHSRRWTVKTFGVLELVKTATRAHFAFSKHDVTANRIDASGLPAWWGHFGCGGSGTDGGQNTVYKAGREIKGRAKPEERKEGELTPSHREKGETVPARHVKYVLLKDS